MTSRPPYHYVAFGCRWKSDLPLPPLEATTSSAEAADITVVHEVSSQEEADSAECRGLRRGPSGVHFTVGDGTSFETLDGRRIVVRTGPEWTGTLAPELFGTVSAFLLARRGLLPMHGSAVCVEGKAVLLCGASGAGKSTLTAAWIASGAQLLSDDLSVVQPLLAGAQPGIPPGRRFLRLYPEAAQCLRNVVPCTEIARAADGKLVLAPPRVQGGRAVPLAAMIVLANANDSTISAEQWLMQHLYRPKLLSHFPGHILRLSQLRKLSEILPIVRLAAMDAKQSLDFPHMVQIASRALGKVL